MPVADNIGFLETKEKKGNKNKSENDHFPILSDVCLTKSAETIHLGNLEPCQEVDIALEIAFNGI